MSGSYQGTGTFAFGKKSQSLGDIHYRGLALIYPRSG